MTKRRVLPQNQESMLEWFFKIKCTQKSRRQGFVESSCFANSQYELHKHCGDVEIACFGFCPKQW